MPIKFVRLCWIDFAGLVRIRVVPKRRYDKMILSPPTSLIGVTAATIALAHHDELGPGFAPVGEIFLHPDKNSYRPLPYEPVRFSSRFVRLSSVLTYQRRAMLW